MKIIPKAKDKVSLVFEEPAADSADSVIIELVNGVTIYVTSYTANYITMNIFGPSDPGLMPDMIYSGRVTTEALVEQKAQEVSV